MPALTQPDKSGRENKRVKNRDDSYRDDRGDGAGNTGGQEEEKTWEEVQFESFDANGYVVCVCMHVCIMA